MGLTCSCHMHWFTWSLPSFLLLYKHLLIRSSLMPKTQEFVLFFETSCVLCILDTSNSYQTLFLVLLPAIIIYQCCSEETYESYPLSSGLFPAVLLFACLHLPCRIFSRKDFLSNPCLWSLSCSSCSPGCHFAPLILTVASEILLEEPVITSIFFWFRGYDSSLLRSSSVLHWQCEIALCEWQS